MNKNNKGFTLAEMLVVVAIIAIIIAIAIPTFTKVFEKSKETSDAANIRNEYSKVNTAVITADETSEFFKSGVWRSDVVSLSQNNEGWQDETLDKALSNIAVQRGTPVKDGFAFVEYDPSKVDSPVSIYYTDKDGNFNDPELIGSNWARFNEVGKLMKNWKSGYITSADSDLSLDYQKLIEMLKSMLGWDEITVSFSKHSGTYHSSDGGPALLVSCVNRVCPKEGSSYDATTVRFFVDMKTGDILAVWTQPGTWGTNNGNVGFWGSPGKQVIEYEKP